VALSSITAERVAKLRDALMLPATAGRWTGQVRHHAAHETLRVGRTFFSWLEQQRLVPKGANPFADFGLAQPDRATLSGGSRTARRSSPRRGRRRRGSPAMELAVDLAFSIGQREADLLRLQLGQYVEIPRYKMDPEVWEQLAEATEPSTAPRVAGIRLRQAKGKVWVEVPIVGATRAASRRRSRPPRRPASPRCCSTTTASCRGRIPTWKPASAASSAASPSSASGRSTRAIEGQRNRARGRARALQFRDFRRTAVVFLGELGIADHLIAAITGHSLDETKRILETYMPRTTGMAARAIALSQARGAPAEKQEQLNG
jgi:hypothetical protein